MQCGWNASLLVKHIEKSLTGIGSEDENWFNMAQNRIEWQWNSFHDLINSLKFVAS
jgi:hypothetical protein